MQEQILQIKWQGREFEVHIPTTATLGELKLQLEVLTNVAPYGQKLIGLTKPGKNLGDEVVLSSLGLKNPTKVMLVGTPKSEAEELQRQQLIYMQEKEQERIQQEIQDQLRREQERVRAEEERKRQEEQQQRREAERARWEMEEQQRRQQQLQEEISTEIDLNAKLEFDIQTYSSTIANKPQIEDTDKVILPQEILEEIIRKRLAMPVTFRVSLIIGVQDLPTEFTAHVGVLDFTAPKDTCYLSYNILQKLNAEEGSRLHFHSVQLPKGEGVQLRPKSLEWSEQVPEKLQKSVLEQQLRKYTTLTEHDIVMVNYQGTSFPFEVVQLNPQKAVSILDTDLNLELLPSTESTFSVTSGTPVLGLEEPINGIVAPEEFEYYSFVVDDLSKKWVVECTTSKGDTNLYLSNKQKKPSQSDFIWCSQHVNSNSIELSTEDPKVVAGTYYLSVQCYGSEAAHFQLTLKTTEITNQGHSLKDTEMTDSNSVLCDNCLKHVPSASFTMHQMNCLRRNFRCPQCGDVMAKSEQEKHVNVKHKRLRCVCGIELEQSELIIHKEFECPLRLVKCLYCPLKFKASEIGAHQGECGARTVKCKYCDLTLKRKEFRVHMERTHNVVVRDLTASTE